MSVDLEQTAQDIARAVYLRASIADAIPTIHVRKVERGRWYAKTGRITIPAWVFDAERHLSFQEYYVAHELAHHLMGRPGHDVEFQRKLASLVPPHVHEWERYYKPKYYRQYQKGMSFSASSNGRVMVSTMFQASVACQPAQPRA